MNGALTITKLKFVAGKVQGAPGVDLCPTTVTVLVGPHNSGKSLALQEIENWCVGANQAGDVIAKLAKFGVFVVVVGELERWLSALGIAGKKTEWLMNAFATLGSDSKVGSYVRPAADDVWEFLDKIAAWCKNPSRQGIA